ncbi:Siroheme decarboxylase NirD subunit [Gammaproteobacteria bacterium]
MTHPYPATASPPRTTYTPLEWRLLDEFQRGFPLSPRPYAELASHLGVSEIEVLTGLQRLTERGAVSRVGPVLRPNRVGCSTLAAMAVPSEQIETVAALVSSYPEVNHNYQREHHYNLWFVVTAADADHLALVLGEIERRCGLSLISLPMREDYHIDLGFPL